MIEAVDDELWKLVSGMKPDEWVVVDDLESPNQLQGAKVDPERVAAPAASTPTLPKPSPD